MAPDHLHQGWAALEYSSPFAQLALALNLNWLALLLYADAFVSPSGTGTTYTATTARQIYAMERSGTVPKVLGRVHPRFGIPRPAMWFNLVVSFIFLFFFRGWGKLAAVISVATIITYLVVPISVMVLRRTAPNMHRPLRVPGLSVLAPVAFVLATLMLFWARWPAHRRNHAAAAVAHARCICTTKPNPAGSISGGNFAPPGGLIVYSDGDHLPVLGGQQGILKATTISATVGINCASCWPHCSFIFGDYAAAGARRRSKTQRFGTRSDHDYSTHAAGAKRIVDGSHRVRR